MATSNKLDWVVPDDTPLLPPATQTDSVHEMTYDMVLASRGLVVTEFDTVPAELMEVIFK